MSTAQSDGAWLARLVRRPLPVLLVFVGLFAFGIAALVTLPIASLPEVDYPTIYVEAAFPGASSETIAATVTAPLERTLSEIEGLRSMTSSSRAGATSIRLQFEAQQSIDSAAVDVGKALSNAASDLPRDLPHPPTYYKTGSSDYAILVMALTSEAMPMSRLNQLGEEVVAQRIETVPGVGRVVIADAQRPAIRILVNPVALTSRDLTMEDLRSAISKATVAAAKGKLTGPLRTVPLGTNDQMRDVESFRGLVIAWRNGVPILLGDVAGVENGTESDLQAGWYNSTPAIVMAVVRRAKANVVRTVDLVKEAIQEARGSLPPSVRLSQVSDRTTNTRAALSHLGATLGVTILAVIAAIFIFVRHAAATLVPALTIPVSLLATLIGMAIVGYTIDNLSLMALAISVGFVVDDAIVVVENVIRRIEQGERPLQAAITGARQVSFTILAITISLVAVFIPVLFIRGVVGHFFREFGAVVTLCVLVSGVVSVTLTPVLCALLLRQDRITGPRQGGRLVRLYASSLDWVLQHQHLALLAFVCVSAGTIWLYVAVPKGFLPRQDMGTLIGFVDAPPGTSAEAMKSRITQLMAIVRQDPAVVTVTAFLSAEGSGSMFVNLKNRRERDRADAVIDRLRSSTQSVPGVQLYLQPLPEVVLGDELPPTEYEYTLTSSDYRQLRTWAPSFEQAFRALPYMRDVRSDLRAGVAQLTLEVDRPLAARLGIDAAAVDDALFQAFGQERAARIFDDASQRYVFIQFDRAFQRDAEALSLVHVRAANGVLVPLSAFSHLKPDESQTVIRHKSRLPVATISFNLASGTSLGTAIEAVREIERNLGVPGSLHGSFEGTAGEFVRSLADEPWLIAAALMIIYLLLGMLYVNAWHPLTILSSLPSAGAGALLSIFLLGGEFTLISLIGVLLLIGIVKKNAIMMVDFALEAERQEGLAPTEAVRRACLQRLRPIMMTTFAALVGALPLALERGPGAELRNPLGTAIVGGLLLSQLLTLYTTPVIYLFLGRIQSQLHRHIKAARSSLTVGTS